MTLEQIQAILDNPDPESGKALMNILNGTLRFTTGLFALSTFPCENPLQFAGSGTFVTTLGSHFILTARHVWEVVDKRDSDLGISVVSSMGHQFKIEKSKIAVFGPSRPANWSELGPGIALLRIPDYYVSKILAHGNVFYDLDVIGPAPTGPELLLLFGIPESLGQFTSRLTRLSPIWWRVGTRPAIGPQPFDYCDVIVDVSDLPSAKSLVLPGVSGGGLWSVYFFESETVGEIRSCAKLRGVAFWEFLPVDGDKSRIVRCHATKSIQQVAAGCPRSGFSDLGKQGFASVL
jgi:hypothetical protein